MPWLIIVLGYFLGSIPTAYVAGHLLKGRDIRQMGDANVGAANAFRQLGAKAGIGVFFVDVGKGALAILIAQTAHIPQPAVLFTGAAAVIGHNWPVFIGFRGGRGESTTIGVLLTIYNSANANPGWTGASHSPHQKECNCSQLRSVYPTASSMLVAGNPGAIDCLWDSSTLPGRLCPFHQDEAVSSDFRDRRRLVTSSLSPTLLLAQCL